jgi:hypothetical protein
MPPRVGRTRCGDGRERLAAKHCCRELAERAAALADSVLAVEQHHRESAECAGALAVMTLAEEQCLTLSAEVALAEYDAQTIASWDAAMVETAKHATMLVVTVLTKLKAPPKVRYGGPPLTHFSSPLTAEEVAELDAATLDKQRCHKMAAREKALADKAMSNVGRPHRRKRWPRRSTSDVAR